MIYFDYASTSPVEEEIIDSYCKFLKQYFANADSLHHLGIESGKYLENAREQVANLLNVKSKEIIFTSSASEANNLALKGISLFYKSRGNRIISTKVEHPSISNTLKQLERLFNVEVKYLSVDKEGKIDLKELESLINEKTILVTTTAIVSETGHRLNIEEVGKFLKKYPKVFYHVDGTQAIGKYKLNLENIDLLSFSAHKFFSLKGVGCLIKKSNVKLEPLICGGEQEEGLRAGTSNVPSIVMMAKSLRLAYSKMEKNELIVKELSAYLRSNLSNIEEVVLNSSLNGSSYIINFSLLGYKNEVVLNELSNKGIYLSSKSACSSKMGGHSSIVESLYSDKERASSTLRISLSSKNTKEEIDIFIKELKRIIKEMKKVQ